MFSKWNNCVYIISRTYFREKRNMSLKKLKKCQNFSIFKTWKAPENPIWNFFSVFLLQTHFTRPLYWSKKTACFYHVSLYFIFVKPQKSPNSRENREYFENLHMKIFLDPKFRVSDQKLLRINYHLGWTKIWPNICWPVLFVTKISLLRPQFLSSKNS